MAKEHVISFRISDEQFDALQARLSGDQPTGMGNTRTPNRMARKIVLDCLSNRTSYNVEEDRFVDWDAVGNSELAAATSGRANGKSRKK